MTKLLSNYFSLNRRYSRSINIERDLERAEALAGYILTERSLDALRRILTGFANPETNRAWTLTGVYGTGKSSVRSISDFSLCRPRKSYTSPGISPSGIGPGIRQSGVYDAE